VLIAQTAIHITFLLSAMAVASTDRLMMASRGRDKDREMQGNSH